MMNLDVFKIRVDEAEDISMTHSHNQENGLFSITIETAKKHPVEIQTFKEVVEAEKYFAEKVSELSQKYISEYTLNRVAFFRGRQLSPWEPNFFSNIEPRLINSITILREKLYLTSSSCESHRFDAEAFIDVVFTNEVAKNQFLDQVTARTKNWIFFELREIPLSNYMDKDLGSNKGFENWCTSAETTQKLNAMFRLNFTHWYVLRISIKRSPRNEWEQIFLRLFEKRLLDLRFKKLEKVLKDLPINVL